MCLPVKKAASLYRARTNQLDPSPRKPYWSTKWRCRFCREKTQDTKHYILECKKAQQILGGKLTKEEMWRIITTLEGEDNDLKEVAFPCFQFQVTMTRYWQDKGLLPNNQDALRLAQVTWGTLHGIARLLIDGIYADSSHIEEMCDCAADLFMQKQMDA